MSTATLENLGPRSALRLLCGAMLLGLLPLFGYVSVVSVLLLLIVLLYRLTGRHLTRGWVNLGRLVIGTIGVAAIYARYGGFLGMEPGISVLVLLIALKAVEARNRRDFRILTLLALFLCLTMLFYSQSLPMVSFAVVVLALALGGLILLETRGESSSLRALGEAGRLLLMAVPLVALLFVLFPRNLEVSFALRRGLFAQSGMNDELRPGSVSSLALSNEDAFRVTFPDGEIPPQSQLYWRGAVLTYGNGMEWDPGVEDWGAWREQTLGGPLIRQRILLRPHGDFWLYALDRPAADVGTGLLRPGHVLRSRTRINTRISYDAISRMEDTETVLSANEKTLLTRAPRQVSARVRNLVEELTGEESQPAEIVQGALRFFRRNNFTYTISPGELTGDELDQFLFEQRAGFCEHYAASFATLMRLAGLPSRVVVGFQGGEPNRAANYVIVRNSDAHAWTEVWLEGKGWERVDPTSVVAPGRLVSGMDTFLQGGTDAAAEAGGLAQSSGAIGLRAIWQEVRLTWDNVQMQWDLHVMDYGREQQQTMLSLAGLSWMGARKLLAAMAAILFLAATLAAIWFSISNRVQDDPVGRLYASFCARAARAGIPRERAEGPSAFARRVAEAFPGRAGAIEAFASEYLRRRYGPVKNDDISALRSRLRRIVLRRG